jgi:hypothetical protein
MNRFEPLITRYAHRPAPARALVLQDALPSADQAVADFLCSAPAWANDLKLFVTVWLGGVVFFGTLIA